MKTRFRDNMAKRRETDKVRRGRGDREREKKRVNSFPLEGMILRVDINSYVIHALQH